MPQPYSEAASMRAERIRNYLRVVHTLVGHDVEELTREVNFTMMHQIEWESALENVDNPEISPSRRAAMFHRLIEQGTQDALHEDPGEWLGTLLDNCRAQEIMKLTAPERIARIIHRMRDEFPDLVPEVT